MLDGLKSLNMHSLCDLQVIYFYALPEIFLLSFKKRLHISFFVCTQQMPGLLDFRKVCWKVTKFIQVEMNF